jgi:hypothetical protein
MWKSLEQMLLTGKAKEKEKHNAKRKIGKLYIFLFRKGQKARPEKTIQSKYACSRKRSKMHFGDFRATRSAGSIGGKHFSLLLPSLIPKVN